MTLDPEQQAEVERLVAERLVLSRARDRLRLLIITSCLGLVVAVVIAGAAAYVVREMRGMQAQMARQASDLEAARQEYQRQLAADRQMQAERAAAAKAVDFKPGQSSAVYNAGLLRDFVSFMGKSGELRERMQHLDSNDPKDLERFADDLEQVLHQGLGTLGQVVLRNTEPEKPALRDGQGPPAPAPRPMPAAPVPAAPALPAAAPTGAPTPTGP